MEAWLTPSSGVNCTSTEIIGIAPLFFFFFLEIRSWTIDASFHRTTWNFVDINDDELSLVVAGCCHDRIKRPSSASERNRRLERIYKENLNGDLNFWKKTKFPSSSSTQRARALPDNYTPVKSRRVNV